MACAHWCSGCHEWWDCGDPIQCCAPEDALCYLCDLNYQWQPGETVLLFEDDDPRD